MPLVADLNAKIAMFVHEYGNRRLRPGTGGYSTPFRGQLFGKHRASEVDAELAAGRTADVLFLGANPNCTESLEAIKTVGGDGDWEDFKRQSASDEFGHVAQHPSGATDRWDPLHDPKSLKGGQKAWALYADWLKQAVGRLDTVAVANILSWGSADVDALMRATCEIDPGLPDRMVAFANGQLTHIITALRPKVVVCPKSVASKSWASGLCVSTREVSALRNVGPVEAARLGCRIRRAEMTAPFPGLPILFIDHPSALRYVKKTDRPRIGHALQAALLDALSDSPRPAGAPAT